MKLLIIRHAIAEDREEFVGEGSDDAQRPLTKAGRKRTRQSSKALRELVPKIHTLASSPLLRAVQTADLIADAYDGLSVVQIAALSPQKQVAALLNWIQQQPSDATVALVGHEPHIGVFSSWMLTGLQESFIAFKKGAVCLLEIDGEIRAGRAKLLWFLKSSQLRGMS